MRRSHKHSPEGKKLFIFIYLYNFGILHFHGILRDLLRSHEISRDPMLTMLTMLKNNFRSIMGREGEERFRCSISCPRESISRVRNQTPDFFYICINFVYSQGLETRFCKYSIFSFMAIVHNPPQKLEPCTFAFRKLRYIRYI